MKWLILVLFIIGSYMVIVHVTKISCSPTRIEYRYVPKNFEEKVIGEDPISDTFADMFAKPGPLEAYKSGGEFSKEFNKLDEFSFKTI
jgi:hypothetical protein